jgi:hypothetical protein
MSNTDDKVREQQLLDDALAKMSAIIRSALLDKKRSSATNTLRWTEFALRLHRGPVDRAITDIDRKNATEARQILREAVPLLEKVCIQQSSDRLRRKAAYFLEIIAAEVNPS